MSCSWLFLGGLVSTTARLRFTNRGQHAVNSVLRSSVLQCTANYLLTVCLTPGGKRNPNLPSPLLEDLTDAQSFYNSFQLCISKHGTHNFSWQASYTFSHSVDDASSNVSIDAINEPPTTQDPFNRKGDRGRSGFDIRHNFVANVIYELPFGR